MLPPIVLRFAKVSTRPTWMLPPIVTRSAPCGAPSTSMSPPAFTIISGLSSRRKNDVTGVATATSTTETDATIDLKITREFRWTCSCVTANFLSAFAENRARFQPRGAARGEPRRRDDHESEQQGDAGEGQRIESVHTFEGALQDLSGAERQHEPDHRADHRQAKTAADDQTEDVPRCGAERDADADLRLTLGDRLRGHAVYADRGEREREDSRGAKQRGNRFEAEHRRLHLLIERLHVEQREARIEALHQGLRRLAKRRRRALPAHEQRHLRLVILEIGKIDERLRRLRQRQVLGVSGDADDDARFAGG